MPASTLPQKSPRPRPEVPPGRAGVHGPGRLNGILPGSPSFNAGLPKAHFLPHIFLGTSSGQLLRPAASRLLLFRFVPNSSAGPSRKAATVIPGIFNLALVSTLR